MVLLLGATGYLGCAFASELRKRGSSFVPLTRAAVDYSRFDVLFRYVRVLRPNLIINAAGYTGGGNADRCETARAEAVRANTLLPLTIARVAYLTKTPCAHVSSGGIYTGAKIARNGSLTVERNLNQPQTRRLFATHPERFHGFVETDVPNCSFRSPPASFYNGTKALAEEVLQWFPQNYFWRPGVVFDECDHPRNFFSIILRCSKIRDDLNSMTHRGDFVRACLDLWERSAPFGPYHIFNPGPIRVRDVADAVRRILGPQRRFGWSRRTDASGNVELNTYPRGCILDGSKLAAAGVTMRPAREAIADALNKWQSAKQDEEWLGQHSHF